MATAAQGEVFLYNEDWGMAAFEANGRGAGDKALVCVPGLTDGLLSLRYLPKLAEACREAGWRLVQPVLSSSYSGWGMASLSQDVQEIDRLLDFLAAERGLRTFALLGSSTGCQDVVSYLKSGKRRGEVAAAVLQAPVSDREALEAVGADKAEVAKYREMAAAMIAKGDGDEALPRAAGLLLGPPHVVSAYRFNSLTGRLTDDDMFSSDLSEEELLGRLGHVAVPTLIAASLDDEYVPKSVDAALLAGRMAAAMAASPLGRVRQLLLKEGGHGLRKGDGAELFVKGVVELLKGAEEGPRLTWEPALAERVRAMERPSKRPLMLALAGMPGSGKSTASAALARLLGPSCLVVPMDGFHVPLAELKERPDAAEAIYRRGAPDTFDPAGLMETLKKIRDGSEEEVAVPGFDHAVGDPTPEGVRFLRRRHEVVLVEGNYLLHEGAGWGDVAKLFDCTVYLDAELEECVARVKERNKVIPGYTAEEIAVRTEVVDRANMVLVQRSAERAELRSGAL